MKIGIVSDSHFRFIEDAMFEDVSFETLVISGLSVFGINKDKSTTDSKNKIKQFIYSNKDLDYLLFGIGKVDIDFVMWYRRDLYGIDIETQCVNLVSELKQFILENCSNIKVGFLLPSLPTVDDDNFLHLLKKYDSLIKYCDINDEVIYNGENHLMTHLERSNMTLEINESIKREMGEEYMYFDINSIIKDTTTGVISQKFKKKEDIEHHLNENTNTIWYAELDRQINFICARDGIFKNDLYHISPDRYFEIFYNTSSYAVLDELVKVLVHDTSMAALINKDSTILDVGCGAGDTSQYLSRYFNVTGEDTASKAIQVAKNKKIKNCNFVCGSSLLEGSKHDIVLCKGPCFFNSPVDEEFIKSLERILDRTKKILVFCMYTAKPYDRRVNNSWYHDPKKIENIFSDYGVASLQHAGNYMIAEIIKPGVNI